MILPNHPVLDPILDGTVFTLAGFFVVCSVTFLVRLANAPVILLQAENSRANKFEHEFSELRAKIANPVPDLAIETRRAPDILQLIDGTIHIVVTDFHITNRSNFAVSIEASLKFDFGGQMWLRPDQDDAPPTAATENTRQLGKHWSRRISLGAHEGGSGYLSYTIPEFGGSPVSAMAQLSNKNAVDLLEETKKELEITEHVTGVTKTVPIRAFGHFSFRDVD